MIHLGFSSPRIKFGQDNSQTGNMEQIWEAQTNPLDIVLMRRYCQKKGPITNAPCT